jgi:hypothetical protein
MLFFESIVCGISKLFYSFEMGCHQLDICRILLWIRIISNLSSTIQSNFKIIFTALRYAAGSCIYVECCCDSGTFPSLVLLYRLTDQSNPLSWLVGWVLYLITDRALYISVPCIFYSELRHLYIVMDMYFVLLDGRLYTSCVKIQKILKTWILFTSDTVCPVWKLKDQIVI